VRPTKNRTHPQISLSGAVDQMGRIIDATFNQSFSNPIKGLAFRILEEQALKEDERESSSIGGLVTKALDFVSFAKFFGPVVLDAAIV